MLPALLLASVTAAPLLLAADGEDLAERRWIAFRDGDALAATILDLNEDRVVARIPSLGIERAEIPLSRLSRGSALRLLREREDLDSVEALTRLAEAAAEGGLHRQAANDLGRAVELAPDDAALNERWSKAREEAAAAALARARRMEELGAVDAARFRYRDVVESWPDDAAAEEAAGRLDALGAEADASAASDATSDPADERFATIDRRLERGRAAYRRALSDPEDLGETEDLLLDAASDQRRALERLDRIERGAQLADVERSQLRDEERRLADRLDRRRELARQQLLETRVALGHHFIVAGDTLEAHRYATLAQGVDPESPRVLNLLRSVAAASARDRRGR